MTEDMRSISAVVGGGGGEGEGGGEGQGEGQGEGRLLILSCPLLATCMPELAVLAEKYRYCEYIVVQVH